MIIDLLKTTIEKTRKETAKEILTDIYDMGLKTYRGTDRTECFVEVSFELLYLIAKYFGVEVEQ